MMPNLMIISVYVAFVIGGSETTMVETMHRYKRQLLYPNSTLFQWRTDCPVSVSCAELRDYSKGFLEIAMTSKEGVAGTMSPSALYQVVNIGVGTPTPIKTVNVNWAFQANFQLPWNRTQIPVDILHANSGYDGPSRRKRELEADYENDARLYHFYKYVEETLNNFGHNGTACVLKTLCQLGAEPLHTEREDDLLHELATFILDPSNDIVDHPSPEALPYVQAFQHGENYQDCSRIYHCTSISLLDLFTKVFD